MDVSTVIEEEQCGAKYYDGGEAEDLFDILKRHGANSVRIRLWNDPYEHIAAEGRNGEDRRIPYGAGTNDLDKVIEISKRAAAHGMTTLLDFHYSDFWADPGKQYPPKAWAEYSGAELADAVYDYTKSTLLKLKALNLLPYMVQVGNELTNGCCWPLGNRDYESDGSKDYFNPILKDILLSGIRAVREVSEDIIVMLHLDNGGNNALYRSWFDGFGCMDAFDVIGLSYYPFWHGRLSDLEFNLKDLATRYHKQMVIAEVSMGHSMKDYRSYELPAQNKGAAITESARDKGATAATESVDELKGMATKEELIKNLDYPMTPEGQAEFMKHLNRVIDSVPDGLCRGYYYWEPAWIPVPGCGWASEASLKYIHDKGPCGNEWANQALFDYEGNALAGLNNL